MKSIIIKTTDESIPNPESGESLKFKLSTFSLIRTAVNNSPPGGYELADMMNRLKLSTVLEEYERGKKKEKLKKILLQEEKENPDEKFSDTEESEDEDDLTEGDVKVAAKKTLSNNSLPAKEAQKKLADARREREEKIKLNTEEFEGTLKLEDDLFEKLGQYTKMTKWAFASQAIVDFAKLFETK